MAKIKIRNFGPISTGFNENDGYMEIYPVTVLIGNQATGKSTFAKLYSTFTWLEKALVREDFYPEDLTIEEFKNTYLKYHSIQSYLHENTHIEYIGTAYKFEITNNTVNVDKLDGDYIKPKICYAPSERNLISTIPNSARISDILRNLFTYLDDYDKAKKYFADQEIPIIPNYSYLYDSASRKTYIIHKTDNTRIELYEASSGIQSITPISIVSQYYSKHQIEQYSSGKQLLTIQEKDTGQSAYNALVSALGVAGISGIISSIKEEENKGKNAFFGILALLGALGLGIAGNSENTKALTKEQQELLKDKEAKARRIIISRFINIIEEPEQNLFPDSQNKVLYDLLECNNVSDDNQLIITTHSPYIISYLTLSTKVKNMLDKGIPEDKTNSIVPKTAAIDGNKLRIYETHEDGSISLLEPYKYLPSDDNQLNSAMMKANEDFSKLLEIEDEE